MPILLSTVYEGSGLAGDLALIALSIFPLNKVCITVS